MVLAPTQGQDIFDSDLFDRAPGGDALVVAVDDLDQAVLQFAQQGHRRAEGLTQRVKERWGKYRLLKAGEWDEDDPEDPLAEREIYIPKLAEFSDFLRANVLQHLVPDPSTMDFVSILPAWAGLEEHSERATALLRHKLRIMQPSDSGGFYQAIDRLLADWIDLGNCLGIVVHDQFGGDSDGDNILEGPSIERIDPTNWYPWSVQVNSQKEAPCTIYAPLSDSDLDDIQYFDVARLRETVRPRPTTTLDPGTRAHHDDGLLGPADELYERFVYFGPLPWRAIGRALKDERLGREDVKNMLAQRFDYDPLENGQAKWWTMEWVKDMLLLAKPYPLALPYGRGPIFHEPFCHVNGRLVGLGLYDRGSWDERLYNAYHRFILRLGALAARPPVLARTYLLGRDWLAERDGEVSLKPDEIIEVNEMGADTKAPFEPVLLNVNTIGLLESQLARHEGNMRSQSFVTSAFEGQSADRTATQAQNNLQRSMSVENYYVKCWENGGLKDLVTRTYVVMQQVIRMTGEVQFAPSGYDEQFQRTYAVYPEHLRSLAFFDIQLTGSSSPGNKIHQLQELASFAQLYMQTGEINIRELIRLHAQMLDIRGNQKLLMQYDQANMQEMVQNLTAAMGRQGVGALSPQAQQAFMQMMQALPQSGMPQGQPAPGQMGQSMMSGQPMMPGQSMLGAGIMPGGRGTMPGGRGVMPGGMGRGQPAQIQRLPGMTPVTF